MNVQQRVYKARKILQIENKRSSRGESKTDARVQRDVTVPSIAPQESIDSALEKNDTSRSGHNAIVTESADVEMHGIESNVTHLQNERGMTLTGTQSLPAINEIMDDTMNMNNLDSNVPKWRLPQTEFIKLCHMFNDITRTPKGVAHAIHDHLGSPLGLKLENIQARVYKERKATWPKQETHTNGKNGKEIPGDVCQT